MNDTLILDPTDIEDKLFSTAPFSPLNQPAPSFGSNETGDTQEFSLESMFDFDFLGD